MTNEQDGVCGEDVERVAKCFRFDDRLISVRRVRGDVARDLHRTVRKRAHTGGARRSADEPANLARTWRHRGRSLTANTSPGRSLYAAAIVASVSPLASPLSGRQSADGDHTVPSVCVTCSTPSESGPTTTRTANLPSAAA